MKAFVAVTLLAACVAAQTFDHQTGLRQLLKREHGLTGTTGLWKDVFGIGKDITFDTVPTTYNTYNTVNGVNILSLDEIIRHPLFQTYYTLPLFRQHFTHPLFQVYLTTPYFQQFWTHPVFPTFFKSQYLFNKYIFPVVYNTVPTTGVTVDREIDLDVDTKNIFGQTVFPLNVNHVQYTQGMDKIIKTLINKPEILEVLADLKTQTPREIEYTVGDYKNVEKTVLPVVKVIDPITGEIKYTVGDYKNVEKTVNDIELTKNAILKNILLNKVPEIYNLNKYESIYPRHLVNKQIVDTVVPTDLTNDYATIRDLTVILRELVQKYQTVLPREFVHHFNVIINKAQYPRDLVEKQIVDTVILPRQLIEKYETVLPREFLNHYKTLVAKYETVLPHLVNNIDTVIPRELVQKFETVLPREFLNHYNTLNKNIIEKQIVDTVILPRQLIEKYETVLPREFLNHYKTLVAKYESVLPHLVNNIDTVIPRELVQKFETVLPREFLNHYNTLNKNIIKPIVV